MISVEEAKKAIVKNSQPLTIEEVSIEKAYGYVLAKDLYSPITLPPFNQSAMDGYAFIYDDYIKNKPISVIGEVAAGSIFPFQLMNGQAVRVFTGAPVPFGANCVVMQEKVVVEGNSLLIQNQDITESSNIRKRGSQIEKNAIALPKGTILTAGAIGYISGMGIDLVLVYRKPKVSIIVTGSELQKPGKQLKEGQIFESNSFSLKAALNSIFIEPINIQSVSDDEQAVYNLIDKAIQESDVVLLSGGISVGDYDFVGKALEKMDVKNIFYKIKQKPGKPLFFGKKNEVLIFALPGNPAAVLSCFYNYVYPSLRLTQGFQSPFLKSLKLPIANNYSKKKGLSNFLKSKIENNTVIPLDGQESYILSSFAIADSMVYLPEDSENIESGALVDVFLLP